MNFEIALYVVGFLTLHFIGTNGQGNQWTEEASGEGDQPSEREEEKEQSDAAAAVMREDGGGRGSLRQQATAADDVVSKSAVVVTWLDIARCRAACAQHMAEEDAIIRDEECHLNGDCRICWDICSNVQERCQSKPCNGGCATACGDLPEATSLRHEVDFTLLSVKQRKGAAVLRWKYLDGVHLPVVYCIEVDGKIHRQMTYDNRVRLKFDDPAQADVRVYAVTARHGVISQTQTHVTAAILHAMGGHGGDIDDTEDDDVMYDVGNPKHVDMSISQEMVRTTGNASRLLVHVKWPQMSQIPQRYVVYYARNGCRVDRKYPKCTEADEIDEKSVKSIQNKKTLDVTLSNLMFNAKYRIWLEYNTDSEHRVESQRETIITDGCYNPDRTFKQCLPRGHKGGLELLRLLDINIKCMYRHGDHVTAIIQWEAPPTATEQQHGGIIYTVQYWHQNHVSLDKQVTTENSAALELQPQALYEVGVRAVFNHSNEQEYTTHYLRINTSKVIVQSFTNCSTDIPQAMSAQPRKQWYSGMVGAVGVVTILAALVAVFIVLTIILALVARYRKIKQTVLRNKACSNSYEPERHSSTALTATPSAAVAWYPNGLYMQNVNLLSHRQPDEWEIEPSQLTFGKQLGSGAFGKVVTGQWNNKKVAVKLLKDHVEEGFKDDLLSEITVMKSLGKHPHIVELLGATTINEPIALVMEYMAYGCLQTFLSKCRECPPEQDEGEGVLEEEEPLDGTATPHITNRDVLSYARQIALALEFLSEKQFVHRDVAARNVLVSSKRLVKLCDFGLTRYVYDGHEYHKITAGKLPLKWMAPESLGEQVYTTASDVWSFGILMWEIVTLGESPYPEVSLSDLYPTLKAGYRMDKPDSCSMELYDLMRRCWELSPEERPSISALCLRLEQLLVTDMDYLDVLQPEDPISTPSVAVCPPSTAQCSPSAAQCPYTPADTCKPKQRAANYYVDSTKQVYPIQTYVVT